MTSSLWLLGPLLASHMFGGMRSTTGNVVSARLTVLAQVAEVEALAEGASRVRLKVTHVPCGEPPATPEISVYQMGDHSAVYKVGQLAVFPLNVASTNPHRVSSVPPNGWSVDQSTQETAWLVPSVLAVTADELTRLCRAQGDARVEQLIFMLASPVSSLAGGAALDLMMLPKVPVPSMAAVDTLSFLMRDMKQPMGLRVAAVSVAARSHHPTLEGSAALCLMPHQPPELQAAAIRGLQARPDLLAAYLPLTLMGPPGSGRISAAKSAAFHKVHAAVGGLTVLAFGPEPDATPVACKALKDLGGEEATRALVTLRQALPPDRAARCGPGGG